MTNIGIYVDTEAKAVRWEGNTTPLQQKHQLADGDQLNTLYHLSMEPTVLQQAEERHNRILDADYSKVDSRTYIEELNHLNSTEKALLLKVLQNHKQLFSGGLGTLKVKPIHLNSVRCVQAPSRSSAYILMEPSASNEAPSWKGLTSAVSTPTLNLIVKLGKRVH